MPMIDVAVYLAVTRDVCVCMGRGQQADGGAVQGIDRGLHCCQTGGEGVLACRQ